MPSGDPEFLSLLAAILAGAALFGGMLFFAALFAPLVFIKLPGETAGGFIRQVFPVYYLAGAVTAALAGLAGLWADVWGAAVALAVAAGFLVARQILMPRINALRDRELAGDTAAGARFARWHRASVLLNTAQLVAVLFVVVRFVLELAAIA